MCFRILIYIAFCFPLMVFSKVEDAWIRVNQLGYSQSAVKVAVLVSKNTSNKIHSSFQLIDSISNQEVFEGRVSESFGAYGPFSESYRLNFSKFTTPGTYKIKYGDLVSDYFTIGNHVFKGAADFVLRYLRQQRCGFNPFLKDSCHQHDGFVVNALDGVGLKDSTAIDVRGGWHDASDYLQYATTSANATFHLLAAYRDYPEVFGDSKLANGLEGENGIADVLDEAKWGLDWLIKMHPKENWMFNQIADDRDHINMRLPKEDDQYGKGFERPVYFIDGKPQQQGEGLNNTKGTSSTAAKLSSAFYLGSRFWKERDPLFHDLLIEKARSALKFAERIPGVTQTVSVKSPYIYAEENFADDMQLAYALAYNSELDENLLASSINYARMEPLTGWMALDTASHYQFYPFINLGHYELAKNSNHRSELIDYYRTGIEQVWQRAQGNAFYRGVPFIWCSNNLTVSFIIQCLWYQELSGDSAYEELLAANFDWLFGVNPWGVSMVSGLPNSPVSPQKPHSAFTYLHGHPLDGGLVDGPVYASIFNNLIGIELYEEDEYAEFQSDLVVYHDDFGDYSTNEPTMDGTASLVYLMAAMEASSRSGGELVKDDYGAVVKVVEKERNEIALVFTGHDYDEGLDVVLNALNENNVQGSFFLTEEFLSNNTAAIKNAHFNGHYIGAHSSNHLLYASWDDRQQTLVSRDSFQRDLKNNWHIIEALLEEEVNSKIFLPSYEWYNGEIVSWAEELGNTVINYTPGLRTPADYTYPEMGDRYMSSKSILDSLWAFEAKQGLSGAILLVHIGTDSKRTDKFYNYLGDLIRTLKGKNYKFNTIDSILAI